jgi:high-affinity iron transporter
MLSSLFLSFREGFEIVLVVGIILTYLNQTNKKSLSKFAYWGIGVGVLVSLIGGYIGFNEAKELEETGEEIFEGIMMFAASGLIAYFIVWMAGQNKNISASIKSSVDKNSTGVGIFLLSFLSVFREGMELIAYILTKVNESASNVALGTALGIILAITVGFIVFKTSVKLNIKLVFKVLGLVLIFLGAEMFSESLVKFIPAGGEALETIAAIAFGGASFVYFLKDDLKSYLKRA